MVSLAFLSEIVLTCALLTSRWIETQAVISLKLTAHQTINIDEEVFVQFHKCLCRNATHQCAATLMYRLTGSLLYLDLSDLSSITNHYTQDPWRGRYLRPFNCVLRHRFFPYFTPPTLICTQKMTSDDLVDDCERFGACQFFYMESKKSCDFNCIGIRGANSGFFHMTLYYSRDGECGTYQAIVARQLPTTVRTSLDTRTHVETSVRGDSVHRTVEPKPTAEPPLHSTAGGDSNTNVTTDSALVSDSQTKIMADTSINAALTTTLSPTKHRTDTPVILSRSATESVSKTLPESQFTQTISNSTTKLTTPAVPSTRHSSTESETHKGTDSPRAVATTHSQAHLLLASAVSAATTSQPSATSGAKSDMRNQKPNDNLSVADISTPASESSTPYIPNNSSDAIPNTRNNSTDITSQEISNASSVSVISILMTVGIFLVFITLLACVLVACVKRTTSTHDMATQCNQTCEEEVQSCHRRVRNGHQSDEMTIQSEDLQSDDSGTIPSSSRRKAQEPNTAQKGLQSQAPKTRNYRLQRQCSDLIAVISNNDSTYIKNEKDDLTFMSNASITDSADNDCEGAFLKTLTAGE